MYPTSYTLLLTTIKWVYVGVCRLFLVVLLVFGFWLCFVSRFAFRILRSFVVLFRPRSASEMLTSISILLFMLGAQHVVLLHRHAVDCEWCAVARLDFLCLSALLCVCSCVLVRFNAPASEGLVTAVCWLSTSARWLPGYRLLPYIRTYMYLPYSSIAITKHNIAGHSSCICFSSFSARFSHFNMLCMYGEYLFVYIFYLLIAFKYIFT